MLAEADACTNAGEIGALLRREGLYSSNLVAWRRARDAGGGAALVPKKRGPVAKVPHPLELRRAKTTKSFSAFGILAVEENVLRFDRDPHEIAPLKGERPLAV